MTNLKCTIIWLVFLLVHLDLELVQCLSYTVSTCPPNLSSECPPEVSDRCHNDQDCEARYPGEGYKCCDNCGKNCVSPDVSVVEVTPANMFKKLKILTKLVAKCPTSPPSSTSPPGPDQECQNDGSCDAKFPGQGLKCCSDGCDFRCLPPVAETVNLPGYCPVPPPSTRWNCFRKYDRQECRNDADCEQKYPALKAFVKCCAAKCRSQMCMIPIQGGPPPTPPPVEGICPRFPQAEECPPEPDNECENDRKCSELHPGLGLKCCIDGCDLRCVPPIVMKIDTKTDISGTKQQTSLAKIKLSKCPMFPQAAECPPEPDDECNNDEKCFVLHPGLGLKCCKDGCDLRCVPPIDMGSG